MSDAGRSTIIEQASPLASYHAHREAIGSAIARVLERGRYILGEEVERFEAELAQFVGTAHAIGVASGTDAVELALRGCGIVPGDVVFTPAHTASATVAAIERSGASPVLVDIDPATYAIAPQALDRAVGDVGSRSARRAVVAVHLYGGPADMPGILEVARRHDLIVVEDCAQAIGASLEGRRVGTFGRAAAFSFYPTKNLGALGDGGAVVTGDAAIAERVRRLREYGWRTRFVSEEPGINSRLDELQAAVLRAKLPCLDADNGARIERAHAYNSALAGGAIATPATHEGAAHVFHQYVIRTPLRDALRAFLAERRIKTGVHYPVPVHLQPAYRGRLGVHGALPESEHAARAVISLPMYPELPMGDVRATALAIREWENDATGDA